MLTFRRKIRVAIIITPLLGALFSGNSYAQKPILIEVGPNSGERGQGVASNDIVEWYVDGRNPIQRATEITFVSGDPCVAIATYHQVCTISSARATIGATYKDTFCEQASLQLSHCPRSKIRDAYLYIVQPSGNATTIKLGLGGAEGFVHHFVKPGETVVWNEPNHHTPRIDMYFPGNHNPCTANYDGENQLGPCKIKAGAQGQDIAYACGESKCDPILHVDDARIAYAQCVETVQDFIAYAIRERLKNLFGPAMLDSKERITTIDKAINGFCSEDALEPQAR